MAVAQSVSITADGPLYFRIRTIGGKDHNLQMAVYNESGPLAANQGGLGDIVVTMGALPLSVGTIVLIVFFAGVVGP